MKNESVKNIMLGFLIVGIVSMVVAFAALSTNLNISDTAEVASQKWNVRIVGFGTGKTLPTGVTEVSSASATEGTSITGLSLDFAEPNLTAIYPFQIKNFGTIDAHNTAISVGTPTCRVNGSALETCPVSFSVSCVNSSSVTVPLTSTNSGLSSLDLTGTTYNGTPVSAGTLNCTYTVTYNDYNYTIADDITVDNLDVSLTYSQ